MERNTSIIFGVLMGIISFAAFAVLGSVFSIRLHIETWIGLVILFVAVSYGLIRLIKWQ
jgi:hypothetical protein